MASAGGRFSEFEMCDTSHWRTIDIPISSLMLVGVEG